MAWLDRFRRQGPSTPKTFIALKETLKTRLSGLTDAAAGLGALSMSEANMPLRADIHGAGLLYAACLGAEHACQHLPTTPQRPMTDRTQTLVFLETTFYFTHFLERLVFSHHSPPIAKAFMRALSLILSEQLTATALPLSGLSEDRLTAIFDERLHHYAAFQDKWIQQAGVYYGQCLCALWPLQNDPAALTDIKQFTQKTALRFLESAEQIDRPIKGSGKLPSLN